MKTVCIAMLAIAASTAAHAQSTIYKHVDENGRITYTNRPMKDAVAMEFEPLTVIPGTPTGMLSQARAQQQPDKAEKPELAKTQANGNGNEALAAAARPAVALVTPVSSRPSLASIEPQLQRKRDSERRRILEEELAQEEVSLTGARASLVVEQQNPVLVAAVRAAQTAEQPTAAQLLQFRNAIDKASGRIRGLQASVAEHEKNIEALKKELGALKP